IQHRAIGAQHRGCHDALERGKPPVTLCDHVADDSSGGRSRNGFLSAPVVLHPVRRTRDEMPNLVLIHRLDKRPVGLIDQESAESSAAYEDLRRLVLYLERTYRLGT